MKGPVPQCLITRKGPSGPEWISVTDYEGNKILFAFSTLEKGREFCGAIAKQGAQTGWYPYNMTGPNQDLRPFLNSSVSSDRYLVVIDANGLAEKSYHVVGLTDLIEAIEERTEEIELIEYRPRDVLAKKL
jgi:hypothetical protein